MRSGIFWPRISLREQTSVAWIKGTVLFWDSIARIVPSGYQPDDHRDIKTLEEADVLTRLNPSHMGARGMAPLEAVHQAFSALLDDPYASWKLKDRYRLEKASEWKQAVSTTMASYKGDDHDPRYGYLLGIRVWEPLRRRLIADGLAKEMRDFGWLGTHPLIADACIRSLATAMAGESWSLVTDQTTAFAAGGFTLDTLRDALLTDDPDLGSSANRSEGSDLIACVIEGLRLDGIEDLPIREILRIREKHADVRQTFLGEIDKIEKEIASSTSLQQREIAVRNAWRYKIQGPLESLRTALLKLNVGTGASAATTFIGALLKGTAAGAALPFDLGLTAFAAGGCALVPLAVRRFTEGSPAQKHPVGYLHLLERDLSAAVVAQQIANARKERVEAEMRYGFP